jgi:hypothetical protein
MLRTVLANLSKHCCGHWGAHPNPLTPTRHYTILDQGRGITDAAATEWGPKGARPATDKCSGSKVAPRSDTHASLLLSSVCRHGDTHPNTTHTPLMSAVRSRSLPRLLSATTHNE